MNLRLASITLFAVLAATPLAKADCLTDIQAIMKAMETSGPYRVEMEIDSAGSKSRLTSDVIMPHSMHMKGEGMEMVMTPNGVWTSQGAALQRMPDGMKDQIQGMIKQGMNLGLSSIKEPECVGETEFEGESYSLFKYNSDAEFMGIKSKSSVQMYVDDGNRPVWMVVDGEAMGIKSLTKQKITYDSSITIADPQ